MPILVIKRHDGTEDTFSLGNKTVTIGRDDPKKGIWNDICLFDKTVARRQATFTKENGDYFIEDLESKNSTFVNEEKIKKVQLWHGDEITSSCINSAKHLQKSPTWMISINPFSQ